MIENHTQVKVNLELQWKLITAIKTNKFVLTFYNIRIENTTSAFGPVKP